MKDEFNPWNNQGKHEDQSSGCLQMAALAIAIAIAFFWLLSCNTPKHMQKVYPYGYFMHGKYLKNHDKPREKSSAVYSR